ncbi:MarR family winged helix-turn-helix transcriptional regulator [Marinicella sediminis]|uniref:MarR family winged helix-turn-helix transcriptional regulator n=1 Tax=Marinicella sediminis TaxID=1792834 RepID=A0ABV7JB50_9GAMM|nr:MarR family transcriptional regulator [Marinicella sediminis]
MKPNQQSDTLIKLWAQTTAITRKLDASLGAVHGIGFAEYMLMHRLHLAAQHTMRRIDLAHELCRSASGVTKMLNPMEKIGLVAKDINPRDARVSLVKLTATGEQTYQQASNTLNQISAEVFSHIDSADTGTMHGLVAGLKP